MTDEIDYGALDPGVRRTVHWLRSLGYETTDSGDGVSKPRDHGEVLDTPHVFVRCRGPIAMVSAADRLVELLAEAGVAVSLVGREGAVQVQASYDPADRVAVIMLFGLRDGLLPAEE